ncbi:MAG: hypothetical protein EU535_00910 [Promethearchaeota archaeon]|nr:MAG: hypothetical protein EU535_00910 [Candidatus Lokiarchaeota archaeon]
MKEKMQMSLIRTTINERYKDSLLNQLSDINAVHIKSKTGTPLKEHLKERKPFSDKMKNLRENLTDLFKKLNINESDFHQLKFTNEEKKEFIVKDLHELFNQISEEIDFFYNRVIELERYIARAKIELENISVIKDTYLFLNKYNLTRESISKFDILSFKVFTTLSKNLPNLMSLFEFNQFPNVYETYSLSENLIAFYIIYPKERESDLKERINIIHAEEVPILKKYLTSTGINFERIDKEIELINDTLTKYIKEVKRLKEDNLLKFAAIAEVVQNIEEYQWAEHQFKELPSSRLTLEFFVPLKLKQQVITNLREKLGHNIILESIDIDRTQKINKFKEIDESGYQIIPKKPLKSKGSYKEERETETQESEEDKKDIRSETPTIMKNFILFRPFETLTRMYGTPSYAEVDPTPFLAITFPLLFGLMFGDIGHGICLVISGMIGGIVFRKRSKDFRNLCWIIFYCGFGAIIGGILYGEFFGMSEIAILGITLEPVKIGNFTLHNPLDNILTVFFFAIAVGVFHINLGWSIQFLNYWRQKRKYLAITDSLCKILLLDGGALLLLLYGLNINAWLVYPYPILLPLIPGLLLIIFKPLGKVLGISYLKKESYGGLFSEGSIETFETVLSVISNVASYIRLLALALAHIALMISIEAMIGLIPSEGVINQALIVIGLIVGNLIVILLEGLLVFLNDIRLHFYEFFFKFYQGSGTEFFPFFLDNNYSEIDFKIEPDKDIISKEMEREIETEKDKKDIDKAVNYISKKYF